VKTYFGRETSRHVRACGVMKSSCKISKKLKNEKEGKRNGETVLVRRCDVHAMYEMIHSLHNPRSRKSELHTPTFCSTNASTLY
jgi:hypothetical protein